MNRVKHFVNKKIKKITILQQEEKNIMRVYAIGEKVEISLLKTIGEIVEVKIISNNSNVKYNVMYVVNNDVSICEFWDWQLKLVNGHAWGEYEIGFIKST